MLQLLNRFKWLIITLCVAGTFSLTSNEIHWEDSLATLIKDYCDGRAPVDRTCVEQAIIDSLYFRGRYVGADIASEADLLFEQQRIYKALAVLPNSQLPLVDVYITGIQDAMKWKEKIALPRKKQNAIALVPALQHSLGGFFY